MAEWCGKFPWGFIMEIQARRTMADPYIAQNTWVANESLPVKQTHKTRFDSLHRVQQCDRKCTQMHRVRSRWSPRMQKGIWVEPLLKRGCYFLFCPKLLYWCFLFLCFSLRYNFLLIMFLAGPIERSVVGDGESPIGFAAESITVVSRRLKGFWSQRRKKKDVFMLIPFQTRWIIKLQMKFKC